MKTKRVYHPDLPTSHEVPVEDVEAWVEQGWLTSDPTADVLRGAALDAALAEAGLPKSGTADEKRARLAEHDADK